VIAGSPWFAFSLRPDSTARFAPPLSAQCSNDSREIDGALNRRQENPWHFIWNSLTVHCLGRRTQDYLYAVCKSVKTGETAQRIAT
jgi:hypothetical protein